MDPIGRINGLYKPHVSRARRFIRMAPQAIGYKYLHTMYFQFVFFFNSELLFNLNVCSSGRERDQEGLRVWSGPRRTAPYPQKIKTWTQQTFNYFHRVHPTISKDFRKAIVVILCSMEWADFAENGRVDGGTLSVTEHLITALVIQQYRMKPQPVVMVRVKLSYSYSFPVSSFLKAWSDRYQA